MSQICDCPKFCYAHRDKFDGRVCRCLSPDCQMGGLGCDNMTVVLVCFLHDQPYQVLVDRCAQTVKARDREEPEKTETQDLT